ncbi:MAG: hypothetical protein KIT09_01035 [Bryobacteraceae bacterium]|nr:hypothetical protein [Bryobacteraceae bacterium]
MGWRIALCLVWAAGVAMEGQSPLEADELLGQIQERAKQNLDRLPDYICVQTIQRSRRPDAKSEMQPLDTLRLEVGLVGDRELFAWPDSARFEERDVTDMVQRGTIGNGAFGLHARNVFLSRAPAFEFKGEETLDGKRTYRYDFDVPAERSTYRLRVQPREALVPFYGSFWADAETLDVARLKVEVDDIPEELGVALTTDEMRYERMEIGSTSFLLPAASELNMVSLTGDATRNRATFSQCRQYVGESSISFQETPGEAPQLAAGVESLRLAPRTDLELTLEAAIDPQRAALGDPVHAVVASTVKEGASIVVPRGATVIGRVVRLERYDQPVDHFIVGLEFYALEFGNKRAEFRATMQKAGPSPGLVEQAKRMDPVFDRKRKKAFMQILVNEQQRGQGVLHWYAKNPIVDKGLRMLWRVEP